MDPESLAISETFNISRSDVKLYLATALGFLSSKVVPLRISAQGNWNYNRANVHGSSRAGCCVSSVSRWKSKTLRACMQSRDFPLNISMDIHPFDFKLDLAIALGSPSPKVVSL